MIDALSEAARSSQRIEGGGYRRDHLRAVAQRVEAADDEVRIMGRKSDLLQTLVAASSGEPAAFAVRRYVLKWRTRQDSNLWPLPSENSGRADFRRFSPREGRYKARTQREMTHVTRPFLPHAQFLPRFMTRSAAC
ncbi:hypothetical protein [uncultured Sphingomonas sp.]|uniref:hypothetical protein n=1 Tax=uncultured Sphingomonas sp. TaxID=158754 RepID=UPI00374854D2